MQLLASLSSCQRCTFVENRVLFQKKEKPSYLDFRETKSLIYCGEGMVAYIASEMIQTQSIYLFIYLFILSLKTTKKEREKI